MSEDRWVYNPVERPLPCVRDEHGEIAQQKVKNLISKIDEELNELKWELAVHPQKLEACEFAEHLRPVEKTTIAEEAADVIVATTTLLEALGIDADMRGEALRRVNEKNRKRDRL